MPYLMLEGSIKWHTCPQVVLGRARWLPSHTCLVLHTSFDWMQICSGTMRQGRIAAALHNHAMRYESFLQTSDVQGSIAAMT